jgi:hypothetical protein
MDGVDMDMDMDMLDSVDSIREELSFHTIFLEKRGDDTGILDQADAFVNLSRDNKTVEEVYLCPFTYPGDDDDDASGTHRYAIWDKIAEGIGNLQALREITIWDGHVVDNDCP